MQHQIQQPPILMVGSKSIPMGPEPMLLQCPHCLESVRTRVDHKTTSKTHTVALLLCVFSCWLCACCPYCCGSCRNANHYCPNCNTFLGTYES
uniref:CSON008242 protein n=1 Tax=Culicoides sonorensis TaxID=179676 RepID=A0A336MY04_CULSO